MKYSVIYSSRTGNTKLLADTILESLSSDDCIYAGEPDVKALDADIIYAGFWTDKGTCDEKFGEFIKNVKDRKLFLFGTAGFGQDPSYFKRIIERVKEILDPSVKLEGYYMCQGKMPLSVRERYEKMLKNEDQAPRMKMLIENFDTALSHPDKNDLEKLRKAIGA